VCTDVKQVTNQGTVHFQLSIVLSSLLHKVEAASRVCEAGHTPAVSDRPQGQA